jgi:aminoglycoside phosphotransferase (APT) family kinase protein
MSGLTTTPNDLVHYLLERGLLAPASVVDERLMVIPNARRNNNFSVVCSVGPSYFVKTLQPSAAQATETLRQEASLYGVARAEAALGPLRDVIPEFYLFDPQRSILVVEHIAGAKTISEVHVQLNEAAEWIAELIGRALGDIHRAAAEALPRIDPNAFRRITPWALSLHQITPSFGQPGVQLQTLLLTYPEYAQALDTMRAGWRPNTVIHGDMKFDNCLITDLDGARRLRIVDWELADLGEDIWDVAGILQNYLYWSAVSTQTSGGAWSTAMPFEKLQPAMAAFWSAWAAARGVPEGDSMPQLERATSFAAARLLQSVMEMLVVTPTMSGYVALLLQTSLNILRDPAAMARMIVGSEAKAYA